MGTSSKAAAERFFLSVGGTPDERFDNYTQAYSHNLDALSTVLHYVVLD